MKVLASTLATLAIGQADKWTGFDYDYGFNTENLERNQGSLAQVSNPLWGNAAGYGETTNSLEINDVFNPHTAQPVYSGIEMARMTKGNGRMCWFCDTDSVYDCFRRGNFQMCTGQDYFCFYHERRRIGHYFNRREKYIDNYGSLNTDLFLVRTNNEAFNLDGVGLQNSKRGPSSVYAQGTDNLRPATDIHVLAGCQQPQACLRQQAQNQAINIGISFYGNTSDDAEIGSIQAGGSSLNADFHTYIPPTSRRNAREGLCRLGKDWTYYSGKLWHYDHGGTFNQYCSTPGTFSTCQPYVNTIETVNSTPINTAKTRAEDATQPMDSTNAYAPLGNPTGSEADQVFGIDEGGDSDTTNDKVSKILWGRGIYDASSLHGHQFWHERESWYNGMRPNGFPDNHYHGGKGTESVCHFCCNPHSSDGMFCNRRMLDGGSDYQIPQTSGGQTYGLQFADGTGFWLKEDSNNAAVEDHRNQFVDAEYVRADHPSLKILQSPMANSYNTEAAWLSEHRFHGMFRNPDSQVAQNYLDPYISGRK